MPIPLLVIGAGIAGSAVVGALSTYWGMREPQLEKAKEVFAKGLRDEYLWNADRLIPAIDTFIASWGICVAKLGRVPADMKDVQFRDMMSEISQLESNIRIPMTAVWMKLGKNGQIPLVVYQPTPNIVESEEPDLLERITTSQVDKVVDVGLIAVGAFLVWRFVK